MKASAAIGVAAGVLSFGTSTADADSFDVTIKGPDGDARGLVGVENYHRSLYVCDTKRDGVGVYAEYFYWDPNVGAFRYDTVRDTNGSEWGCGEVDLPSGYSIDSFNGHSRDGGSTGWITA